MAQSDASRQTLTTALDHHRAGRIHEAEALYRQLLTQNPNQPGTLHLLGVLLGQMSRLPESLDLLTRATQLAPRVPEFHANRANALKSLSRADEAVAAYRQALALKPQWAEVHHALGRLLDRMRRTPEAIDAYQAALRASPGFAAACVDLGVALSRLGRNAEAIGQFRRAMALKPDMLEPYICLGGILSAEGSMDEAIDVMTKGVSIEPNCAELQGNLGSALLMRGRCDEAIAAFKKAIEIAPNLPGTWNNLAGALCDQGRLQEAEEAYQRAIEQQPTVSQVHSNYLWHLNRSSRHTPQEIFDEHRKWAEKHAAPLKASIETHANDRDESRRLRIGYVSADFRRHSVAFFLEPILANHNRKAFEIHCFADELQTDEITQQLRRYADQWHSILPYSDEQVAQLVRKEKIDILIDLSGHTGPSRLLVFARKPAPVQVTYLGYPNTTGLETVDYRLTDAIADPPGMTESLHTEELVRLADGFLCYRIPAEVPDVTSAPTLSTGYVTFGSFNNIAKTSPVTMKMWGEILREIPAARLALKFRSLGDPGTRKVIRRQLAESGVDVSRVDFLAHEESLVGHLGRYGQIDIALDTFPYSGTTTTCEALTMGVPVATLAGRAHVSRVGASLLTTVGLSELIAQSNEAYVGKAVAISRDVPRLVELRAGMRQRLKDSMLTNEPAFVRRLEAAYREMWRRWRASHVPTTL